ncbi:long polar fimbrial protein LpfD [Enterobacteriaceae bacterium 89]|nr:long polar fimbrial protein LpfD [Enterobacteriaceae bacterium 89]
MKKNLFLLSALLWLFAAHASAASAASAASDWGPCKSDTVHMFTPSFSEKVTDSSQNYSGKTFENFYSWNNGQQYYSVCECPDDLSGPPPTYFSATVNLPAGHAAGWYKVNDSLEVSTAINIRGKGEHTVPFSDISNNISEATECEANGGSSHTDTGTQGTVSLYIAHPFVGVSVIPQTSVAVLYMSKKAGNYDQPLVEVLLSGTVEVEQGCELNTGAVVNIPLGEYDAKDFKVAAGSKPQNVQVIKKTLVLYCHNLSDGVKAWIRLEGDVNPNNATAIDIGNPDVGVQVEGGESQQVLIPNDRNSEEPLALGNPDSSGVRSAVFNLEAWPISTTGKAPASGDYSGIATLRVDVE